MPRAERGEHAIGDIADARLQRAGIPCGRWPAERSEARKSATFWPIRSVMGVSSEKPPHSSSRSVSTMPAIFEGGTVAIGEPMRSEAL